MAPCKLIAIGNPGAGKSTFGNCLMGKPVFDAKLSEDGNSVTTEMSQYDGEKYKFVDVPGLADPDDERRKTAAAAITKSLQEEVDTKILFFVRTFQGRIITEDKVTMRRVADAMGENLQEDKYGIIINQFPKKLFENMTEAKATEWIAKVLAGLDEDKWTRHVFFNPHDDDLNFAENTVKPLPEIILNAIDKIPMIRMNPAEVQAVNIEDWESARAAMERYQEGWNDVLRGLVKRAGHKGIDIVEDMALNLIGPMALLRGGANGPMALLRQIVTRRESQSTQGDVPSLRE